jgi:acyl-coenzyme A thioesterase PaaI-like protein
VASGSKKSKLDFNVFPLWKFYQENYGMEKAFEQFGPYMGANIKPKIMDQYTIEVEMPLVLSNTNYVGTQFGGSLYSMCDPFFMFILMWNLGDGYIVWDKSAKIEFVSPGKSKVKAKFHIDQKEIDEVKNIVSSQKKVSRFYLAEVRDEEDGIVAKVEKELYIRRKI